MKTAAEILEALRNDEFTFYYQPKISLITGKVIGAEALIRWIRPDGSIIMPSEFIPVAEDSDLIAEITRHMFPKLIQDMVVLRDVEELTLAFNASARDFHDDQFTRMALSALENSQLPPSSLQVELTETITLQNDPLLKKHILPLREAGVGLAMDDFGKGYSSIDTLSQWPFSAIKLDQGLISRMLQSEKNATIVESSIRMAHELGISVVAEGVETNEQYHHLLAAGCRLHQGTGLLDQPGPAAGPVHPVHRGRYPLVRAADRPHPHGHHRPRAMAQATGHRTGQGRRHGEEFPASAVPEHPATVMPRMPSWPLVLRGWPILRGTPGVSGCRSPAQGLP